MSTDRIATAAHVHVLLRRKTGRVTDTEWMASNAEYAAEIVRFCREKAASDGHTELAEWAERLERVMAMPTKSQQVPLAQKAANAFKEHMQQTRPAPRAGGWPMGSVDQTSDTTHEASGAGPQEGSAKPDSGGRASGTTGLDRPSDTRYIGRLR